MSDRKEGICNHCGQVKRVRHVELFHCTDEAIGTERERTKTSLLCKKCEFEMPEEG